MPKMDCRSFTKDTLRYPCFGMTMAVRMGELRARAMKVAITLIQNTPINLSAITKATLPQKYIPTASSIRDPHRPSPRPGAPNRHFLGQAASAIILVTVLTPIPSCFEIFRLSVPFALAASTAFSTLPLTLGRPSVS
jgi:hypothetical protein